nr:Chain B, SMAC [synthetic construct]1OXQ_F Chain F, AVPIAQKSE (Smac) peptide [synthetic construct]1TW6_C Chain C, Diablo homolog, mitochondrial [Homo sapiens]1TW6_D Chain D, Diablo homolog, mitochondrial [Homo sapiens]
AVPIAQKSE